MQHVNIFQEDIYLAYVIVGVCPGTDVVVRRRGNLIILYVLFVVGVDLWFNHLIVAAEIAACPVAVYDRYARVARVKEA